MTETVLTVKQAAKLLQISPPTLRQLIRRRRLRGVRLGRVYRTTQAAVLDFLKVRRAS